MYNSLFRPQLDRLVRSIVVKSAQGNNRPAAEVIAVSPFPVSDLPTDAHPGLPDELNTCLVQQANQYARDIAPKLRDLLAEPSFVAGLERFGHALSGRELIHTSSRPYPTARHQKAARRRDASQGCSQQED